MTEEMRSPREELASQLLWEYVQRVREQPDAALTRGEVYELAETLALASTIPSVVAHSDEPAAREAIQSRLAGARPPAAARRPPAARTSWLRRPALILAPLAGAALAAALAFFGGSGAVPEQGPAAQPPGVMRLSEEAAHEMVPQYVKGELNEQGDKNIMWHLIRCRGCYRFYRSIRPHPRESVGPLALRAQ